MKWLRHNSWMLALVFSFLFQNAYSQCEITDLVVTPGPCENGTFFVTLNFQANGVSGEGFKVQGNGINYGIFNYSNLPITIGPLSGNGVTPYEFVVRDLLHPDCSDFFVLGSVSCGGSACEISNIFAEAHLCDNDGKYYLDIEFDGQGTGNAGFKIKANNLLFGPFDYGQSFYTIGPLQSGQTYEIIIRDVQYPDCQGWIVFGPVFCGNECQIFDLVADVSECNEEGQFFVTLDFEHDNTGNEGFKVFGNGNVYGYFEYDDLPVTLGPFQTNNPHLEFAVADLQHPDCHDFVVIETPDCGASNGDCAITELVAEVHPCLSNGTFFVTLDFQHQNTSGFFVVKGNGVNYGTFSYSSLPISIGPLAGNGTTVYEFLVRDLHFENCKKAISIGTVDCSGSGDCQINDLVVEPGECHPDGTYNLVVQFEYEHPTNSHFDVFHNGSPAGYFPLTNVPATLHHVQGNGNAFQVIKVCINDNPDCCATVEYETPDCEGANLVWPGDTNADHVADHFDLLNIGLGFNAAGPHRTSQNVEWQGQAAANWNENFEGNLNLKHGDANGDGKITAADMEVLQLNFGKTHGMVEPPVFLAGTENAPPFFVDLPDAGTLVSGSQFTAPIVLGNDAKPVGDIYGIAFTLHFDPQIIEPASLEIQFNSGWLGNNLNLLHFDHQQPDSGKLHVALVRTDQNSVSGYGPIATLQGVIGNVSGQGGMSIEISDVKAIRKNESLIALHRPIETVELTTGTTDGMPADLFSLFPNPVNSTLWFSHPKGFLIESIGILDLNGRVIRSLKLNGNQLDVSDLKPGVYFLKIEAGGRFFKNRIVKF